MSYAEVGQVVTGVTGTLLLWLAAYGVSNLRHRVPGTEIFVALTLAAAVWSFGYMIEKGQVAQAGFMAAARMEYLGLVFVPPLWLLLSLHWIEHPLAKSRLFTTILLGAPALLLAVVVTNDLHHLYYSQIVPTGRPGFAQFGHGPLYTPVVCLFLLCFVFSVVLAIVRQGSERRLQPRTVAIVLINLFPVLGTSLFQAGFRPGGLDMTIFSLLPTFSVMAWGLFQHNFIRIVPIARELVLESMDQAVLVFDPQDNLVDHNPAARGRLSSFVASLKNAEMDQGEFRVEDPQGSRTFRFRRSPLIDRSGQNRGSVVLLTDVTEEKRLLEELAHEASHDSLTGAFNRRQFVQRAVDEAVRARREGSDLSLILLDLDHFKSINDHYGHPAGDEVLKGLVTLISGRLRPYDVLARVGGEEFAVLLPNLSESEARQVAERWREALSQALFVFSDSQVAVTASFGVSTLSVVSGSAGEPRQAFDLLFQAADRALYRAKETGRNRVV